MKRIFLLVTVIVCLNFSLPAGWLHHLRAQPDFNRDVRPILSAKCFACHGPDEEAREADLRLDNRESALESDAFVPGKSAESELIERIFAEDDSRMPPIESGEPLTEKEKKTLKDWIDAGGKYSKHWAFVAPRKPDLPPVSSFAPDHQKWIANPIDHFVLKKLIEKGKAPSSVADRYTLVRRVYLDLIGLPPTPEQADTFVSDNDPLAYEKLVDQLLNSKAYGEKWARQWLDLARYADTNGYEKDRPRSIWPFRDWVIRAINEDMPFDQFTVEQLAGDMLPSATNSQRVATGFHRNTMLNEEGGIDPLEYRFYAMVDRVATTGTIWMGLTTGCAQCHSHKYDPISQTDYYRIMAFLNNADEPDLAVDDSNIEASRKKIEQRIAQAESHLRKRFLEIRRKNADNKDKSDKEILQTATSRWIESRKQLATKWDLLKPSQMKTNLPKLSLLEDRSVFASGDFTKRDVYELDFDSDTEREIAAIRLEVLPDDRLPAGGPGNAYYEGRKGDFFLSELNLKVDGESVEFGQASTTYGKISIGSGSADGKNVFDREGSTGWSTSGQESRRNVLVLNLNQPVRGKKIQATMIFERHFVASLGRFRFAVSDNAKARATGLDDALERQIVSFRQGQSVSPELVNQFLMSTPLLKKEQTEIARLKKQLPRVSMTMVMRERDRDNPRKTFRHHRGEYLSPREVVTAQLPSLFNSFEEGTEANRLNFAKWLVSKKNPLVARVTVNRHWQSFFGRGLVESSGDFGTQSPPPSHPELLDWLAINFQESGWSRKKLHRLIVTSATYRQNSTADEKIFREDPSNEWLARGPRFRVDAEVVRDIMLSASGKLSPKMFGPSVYPPQPASVTAIAYGNTRWPVSKGEDRFRRSLYTFSKRTAPFAAYQTFNSPSGENCVARRNRSNTPLQALTLLNDEMFVELAKELAVRAQSEKLDSPSKTVSYIFRRILTRPPSDSEIGRIIKFQQKQMDRLANGELQAKTILGKDGSNELAAWTLVARALMSLDEAITKQ